MKSVKKHTIITAAKLLKRQAEDSHHQVRYFSNDEAKRLLDALDTSHNKKKTQNFQKEPTMNQLQLEENNKQLSTITPPELINYVKLLAFLTINTGLRQRAVLEGICELKWGDVDLDKGTLTIDSNPATYEPILLTLIKPYIF